MKNSLGYKEFSNQREDPFSASLPEIVPEGLAGPGLAAPLEAVKDETIEGKEQEN